jgi:hypothetical protein
VLFVTAYRMVERHAIKAVVRSTHTDAAVFALTAAATSRSTLSAVETALLSPSSPRRHLASTGDQEDDASAGVRRDGEERICAVVSTCWSTASTGRCSSAEPDSLTDQRF